jgi:pimeloyl-ACP methyl ester carboxylesterase
MKLFFLILISSYLIYLTILFISQRKMLFPAHMIDVPQYDSNRLKNIEQNWIEIKTGRVETWFLPAKTDNNIVKAQKTPLIIFAHGNGELIDFWADEFLSFTKQNISVLLVEYPGYGRSQGSPSQDSITEIFVKAYDLISQRDNIDPDKIIFFGRSIGGGAVCSLARKRKPAAIILMSTFINTKSFAGKYFAPGTLILDPFDNLKTMEQFNGPALILHGRYDELIPYDHAVQLHKACKNSKLISYDCGHNNCPPDFDIFINDVKNFLKKSVL